MGRLHASSDARSSPQTRHVPAKSGGGDGGGAHSWYAHLMKEGVVLVDCSHHWEEWREMLIEELESLGDTVLWAASGGYGNIGVPSMAKSVLAKTIDKAFYGQIQRVLKQAIEDRGGVSAIRTAYARMVHQRFGMRPRTGYITYDGKKLWKASPRAEPPNRVVYEAPPASIFFDGFVNLGCQPMTFMCAPGTGYGFRTSANTARSSEKVKPDRVQKNYIVPPGWAIVYDSTIVRSAPKEAVPKTPPQTAEDAAFTQLDQAQLFKYVSWWMTVSKEDNAETPDQKLKPWSYLQKSRPPRLPSGQDPSFVPHQWTMHPERRADFVSQFGGRYTGRTPRDESLKQYPPAWRRFYEVLPDKSFEGGRRGRRGGLNVWHFFVQTTRY